MNKLKLIFPRVFVQIVAPYIDVDLLLKNDTGVQVLKKLADKWKLKSDPGSEDAIRRNTYNPNCSLRDQMKRFFSCVLCEKTTYDLHRRTCKTCRQNLSENLSKYRDRYCWICESAFTYKEAQIYLYNMGFEPNIYCCKNLQHKHVCYQCEKEVVTFGLKWVNDCSLYFCRPCGHVIKQYCPELEWEDQSL